MKYLNTVAILLRMPMQFVQICMYLFLSRVSFPLSPLPLFPDIFQHSDRVNEFHCGRGAWSSGMFPTYFDGSLADRRFLIFLSRASYELSLRIAARGDTRARALIVSGRLFRSGGRNYARALCT